MSAAIEFSSWNLIRKMPAPIAHAYQQYSSVPDQDLARKAKTLFAVAEVSARYLAAILSADYLSLDLAVADTFLERATRWLRPDEAPSQKPTIPRWIERLPTGRGLEFGPWIHAYREIALLIPPKRAFIPEAVKTVRASTFGLLEQLNTLRNQFAHPPGGFDPLDEEIQLLIQQGKPALARWLSELRYLVRYPLCVGIARHPFAPHRIPRSYYVKRFMGIAVGHTEFSVDVSADIQEHQPFLVSPSGDALLYLWPFLVTGEPGEDGGFGRLFVFDCQTRVHFGAIAYAGVGTRSAFHWESPSGGGSLHWLRSERQSMPGVLRVGPTGLRPAHDEAPDALLGRTIGEARKYRLVDGLGEGATGVVYVACDAENRTYAIKVLKSQQDTGLVRRFEQEIEELGRVASASGIINLLDWGTTSDAQGHRVPYYAMDYAERGDLSTFIQQSCIPLDESDDPATWDLEPRLTVLEQLATALSELHRLQLVHRDVKPHNVLLMGDGSIRLCDLGLVKVVAPGPAAPPLTRLNSIVGTFEYMPPEQLQPGTRHSGMGRLRVRHPCLRTAAGEATSASRPSCSIAAREQSAGANGAAAGATLDQKGDSTVYSD
jgi:hypothetical protein